MKIDCCQPTNQELRNVTNCPHANYFRVRLLNAFRGIRLPLKSQNFYVIFLKSYAYICFRETINRIKKNYRDVTIGKKQNTRKSWYLFQWWQHEKFLYRNKIIALNCCDSKDSQKHINVDKIITNWFTRCRNLRDFQNLF